MKRIQADETIDKYYWDVVVLHEILKRKKWRPREGAEVYPGDLRIGKEGSLTGLQY